MRNSHNGGKKNFIVSLIRRSQIKKFFSQKLESIFFIEFLKHKNLVNTFQIYFQVNRMLVKLIQDINKFQFYY